MTTHYETLGVPQNASQAEIKSAFRKLASKHHPDKGGDTKLFQSIQSAYSVLGDEQARTQYDAQLQGNFAQHFSFHGSDLDDILSRFGFGRPSQPQNKNQVINLQTQISLEDAYSGKELVASIKLPSGKERLINAKIPAGVHSGEKIIFAGLGDDSNKSAPPGDIHLSVFIAQHNRFQRHYNDLVTEVDVPVISAMIGGTITVETISKKTVSVKIPAGTQHSQIITVPDHGMPVQNTYGNLLLVVKLVVPTFLTDNQLTLLKQVQAES